LSKGNNVISGMGPVCSGVNKSSSLFPRILEHNRFDWSYHWHHPTQPTPPTVISTPYQSQAYSAGCYMLINSPDCSTCLFSWYGLLIMVGGVGGDFSQTHL